MAVVISLVAVAALVGVDQLIKYFVVLYLKPVTSVEIIKGVLNFTYVENTGAAFGSFSAYTAALTVVSLGLLAVTVYFLITKKSGSRFADACLILMISGGIGNIIDRIRLHYVVDFIEPVFVDFAVFNFADCLVTVGAFALIIYLFVGMFKERKNASAENKNAEKN